MKLIADLGFDIGELSLQSPNHRLDAVLQPINSLVQLLIATTRCLLLDLFSLLASILVNVVPGH